MAQAQPWLEYEVREVTELLGTYMQEQAVPRGGQLVYPYGVKRALRYFFSEATEDPTGSYCHSISKRLVAHGFKPVQPGGWSVPPGRVVWRDEARGGERHKEGPPITPEAGPVRTSYLCQREGCNDPGPYATREDFANHSLVHARAAQQDHRVCPVQGCTAGPGGKPWEGTSGGLGGHIQGHRTSKQGQVLLDAIRAHPGRHPRQYAEDVGISASMVSSRAYTLRKLGLIKSVGLRSAARYYPPEVELPGQPKAAKVVVHNPPRAPKIETPKAPERTRVTPRAEDNGLASITVALIPTSNGQVVLWQGKLYRLVEV